VPQKSAAEPRSGVSDEAAIARLNAMLDGRPVVLVGMMGAGKTTVGRRLAARLGRRFVDSDAEIEKAAGMSIEDIFSRHGEAEFRAGEARVIARVLKQKNIVLGTGGGAFNDAATRDVVGEAGVSVWIKADFEVLFARVSRRSNRPLLKTGNPRETLKALMDQRYPIYALADVTVTSRDVPHEQVVDDIVGALIAHLEAAPGENGHA